jgi:hypothetical protein
LYEQKIVEIFDNGDISTASDYGRKLGDFKSQKYPIITKEKLEAQYKMADGGSTGSGLDPVKVKVVMAVGLDSAIEFYDADYPIRPYQLLERAVRGGYITLDEINERVVDSAMETAQDNEDMEEVGSSDFGAYLRDFLDEAGFKVGYVNGRLTREFADGGGVEERLVGTFYFDSRKDKTFRVIYSDKDKISIEYFDKSKKPIGKIEDVQRSEFEYLTNMGAWAKYKQSYFADGGEIRRFDRHEQMDSQTREEILDIVSEPELRGALTNYLYGLYDGYDYSQTERFKEEMKNLKSKDSVLHDRINAIYKKIDKYKFEKYDDFADGGMFDDNDGFMKADNNRDFRYPEMEVYVETFDEPIDLTSNVSSKTNNVVVRPLNEDIDLSDDGRIRAIMTQSHRGSAESFSKINPRAFEFIGKDLPMPTSHTHKND